MQPNQNNPEQAAQPRCIDMPNDAVDGHHWSFVHSPQSIPTDYRECRICRRIDASETIAETDRLARLDERNTVALDNYRGHTFSDSTDWKGKFEKFIDNNEKRIKQLSTPEDKSNV